MRSPGRLRYGAASPGGATWKRSDRTCSKSSSPIEAPIAQGIHRYELRDPAGGELPAFTAGAHIGIRVPNGALRKYSLCNDPGERDRYEIAVKREDTGQGGSASFIDNVRAGMALQSSAPRNDFALAPRAPRFLFIAGGIGITPILSMMRYLASTGGAPFKLYYCTRSPDATAFLTRPDSTRVPRPCGDSPRLRRSRAGARPLAAAGEADGRASVLLRSAPDARGGPRHDGALVDGDRAFREFRRRGRDAYGGRSPVSRAARTLRGHRRCSGGPVDPRRAARRGPHGPQLVRKRHLRHLQDPAAGRRGRSSRPRAVRRRAR